MRGLQRIYIQRSGKTFLNLIIVFMVLSLLLSGCSIESWFGEVGNDWLIDIYAGYAIEKIHSDCILLTYKENPEDIGRAIVIQNYFVTGYQIHEPHIYLEGIGMQMGSISEEERKNRVLSYYIVNTVDGEVIGPFETDDAMEKYCTALSLEFSSEWIQAVN